jgi:hypothetical protein
MKKIIAAASLSVCIFASTMQILPQIVIDGKVTSPTRVIRRNPKSANYDNTTITLSIDKSTTVSIYVEQAKLNYSDSTSTGSDFLIMSYASSCSCESLDKVVALYFPNWLKWQGVGIAPDAQFCEYRYAQLTTNRFVVASLQHTDLQSSNCIVVVRVLPNNKRPPDFR